MYYVPVYLALCLRVQRLILNLLPTYCFKSNATKLLQQLTVQEGGDGETAKREASLSVLQIANSILRYAAVTMNRDGMCCVTCVSDTCIIQNYLDPA